MVQVDLPFETTPEASPPVSAETSEAVALAEIHSETAVEIAQIGADASVARIEASNEGDTSWQEVTTHLREEVRALGEAIGATAAMVEALVNQSTPLPSEEAAPLTEPEASPEALSSPEVTTDTSATPAETSSETQTEVHERNEEGERARETLRRRAHRMI